MKRLILFLLFLGLGFGLFWGVLKFIGWQEIKSYFLAFTLWQAAIIFALGLTAFIVDGWRWKGILKEQGIDVSLFSLWKIVLASFPLRYFLPMVFIGGDFLQAYLLRKKHQVPWAMSLASISINKILIWTANLLIISFGIFYFFFIVGGFPRNLLLILVAGFLIFTGVIFFFYFNTFKRKSFLKSLLALFPSLQKYNGLRNVSEELVRIEKVVFSFFQPKHLAFWKGLAISFLKVGLWVLSTWFLIIFLGKRLDFLATLSLLGFSILTAMMPIPAKLGSHEAVQGAAFNALGLGAGRGVGFAMLGRGVEIAIALIGIVFLLKWFGRGLLNKFYER